MARKRQTIPITTRPKRRTLGFGTYIQAAKKRKKSDRLQREPMCHRTITHTVWESDRGIISPAQSPLWHEEDTETKPNLSPKAVGEIPPWEDDNIFSF